MRTLICGLLAFCVSLTSFADINTENPGYFDFDLLTREYGEPRVMINLGSTLLKLISSLDHDDPATAQALSQLEHVRVHVYPTVGNTAAATSQVTGVIQALKTEGWENVVQVREPNENVDIYMKSGPNAIQGFLVMAVDYEEAVFINVLGDIEPAKLSAVLEHIDVDVSI